MIDEHTAVTMESVNEDDNSDSKVVIHPLDERLAAVAVKAATRTWRGSEGALSREMRSMVTMDEAFLSRWLGVWMLARSNPRNLRPSLAACLNAVLRPCLLTASDEELPSIVNVSVVK